MNFWLDDIRPAPKGRFWEKTMPQLIPEKVNTHSANP